MIKNNDFPFDFEEFTKIKNNHLNIDLSWKNYEKDMEQVCLFIALLDKEANGIIGCEGDEKEDMWEIRIDDSKIFISRAKFVFDDEEEFNLDDIENDKLKKALYNSTKNKELKKELIVNAL